MTYRIQLTYPIESHTVHKTNNAKKAIKKCYHDYRYYNGTKDGIFGVTDLNSGVEYHFEANNSRIRNVQKGGYKGGYKGGAGETVLDVLEKTTKLTGDDPRNLTLPKPQPQIPRCTCMPSCSTTIPRCMSTMCSHNPICGTMPLCSINNYTTSCNHIPQCVSVPQCSSPCTHMPPCNNVPCCNQKTVITTTKPPEPKKPLPQKKVAQTDNWCMYL